MVEPRDAGVGVVEPTAEEEGTVGGVPSRRAQVDLPITLDPSEVLEALGTEGLQPLSRAGDRLRVDPLWPETDSDAVGGDPDAQVGDGVGLRDLEADEGVAAVREPRAIASVRRRRLPEIAEARSDGRLELTSEELHLAHQRGRPSRRLGLFTPRLVAVPRRSEGCR